MTTRHAHTRQLAAAYRRARENKDIAYHALIESLAPNYRKVYDHIHAMQTSETLSKIFPDFGSDEIKVEFDWSPQYASSILKELAEFGLLEREAVLTDSGREFCYRLAQ